MKLKFNRPFLILIFGLVLAFSLNALAGDFSASFGVGYEALQLENSSGYKDKTSTLLSSATIDWAFLPAFDILLNLEQGSTKSAEIDSGFSHPLHNLKGHYNRQVLALNYYLGNTFRLGLGLGLDIDREGFTWTGDNDDTLLRYWQWNRNSLGVSSLVSLVYQDDRFGFKTSFSYTPFFKSDETLVAFIDEAWEAWQTESLKTTLLKANTEATINLTRNFGILGGVSYRRYQSPAYNVPSLYENSDGEKREVDSLASKVLEKGSFVYLGLKLTI
ncbi:MAG: hypothetical protein PHD88_03235 [Firmicutes bacterium]|nr:hypothetical protein [Bacillota bacterium]MDD4693404.1 hypothetical protein [Bacillota bacterium]